MAAASLSIETLQDRQQDGDISLERRESLPTALASPSTVDASASSVGSRLTKSPTSDGQVATGTNVSNTPAPGKKTPNRLSRNNTAPLKDADGAGTSTARATPSTAAAAAALPSPANIDPLSQHIFIRTNTDHSIPQRLRHPPNRPESPVLADGVPRASTDLATKLSTPIVDVGRDKKKGQSFLSRLSMRGKKKDDDFNDDESELSEQRTDGANARVFSSMFGAGGYIPHHKEPPRYIRVKAHNKKNREFNCTFLAQELVGSQPPKKETDEKMPVVTVSTAAAGRTKTPTGGAIWATEFSKDGKYLAAAGKDQIVRVWAVIATHEDRKAHEEDEVASRSSGGRLSAPVFREKPVREFDGHTGEVLDLSWSKNNFLLSTSMDKTVRLWHVSRQECLCTFKHKEFVSKVAFHPKDDRFFLAGCLDTMLRLWSIPDKSIAYSAQLPEMITAVAFSPDGKLAIAGLLNGLCHFYETEGLKPQGQIHVRSTRGKNAKGSKITGIQTLLPPDAKPGDIKVLITSTDSRIRIYNLRDKSLDVKFKGHEHTCSQIGASFSDDGSYIVCGSEDRKAFIWSLSSTHSENKDKKPCESFYAHGDIVTTAIFAPTKSRQLLGLSGDPIYDLCNPPPVTLMSLEESTASQTALSEDHQGEIQANVKRPEESPAYIARSTHYDGNIIVTTDDTGVIKVFRQDCAAMKRKHESWETGSTFSKTLAANPGLIGRSASILTRTSASSAAHSRRGSLSQAMPPGISSGPPSVTGTPQLNSDRILSWRQDIESNGRPGSLTGTPTRSERSISPSKTSRTPLSSAANLASEARKQPYAGSSPITPHFSHGQLKSVPASPSTSSFGNPRQAQKSASKERMSKERERQKEDASQPPAPSFSFRPAEEDDDHLRLDPAGASYSFWNLNKWKGMAGLRGSVSSTGNNPGGALGSHSRSSSEAASKDNSVASTPAGKDKGAARRRSMGSPALPKSPLARPEAATSAEGDVVDNCKAKPTSSSSPSHAKPAPSTPPGKEESGQLLAPCGDQARYRRESSVVSRLSSELSSDDAEAEGEELRCSKCGGRDFKARKMAGMQRLLCGRCGKAVDDKLR